MVSLTRCLAADDWRDLHQRGWMLALPQSGELLTSDAYMWNDFSRDATDVVELCHNLLQERSIDPERVILGGFSAGGGLAIQSGFGNRLEFPEPDAGLAEVNCSHFGSFPSASFSGRVGNKRTPVSALPEADFAHVVGSDIHRRSVLVGSSQMGCGTRQTWSLTRVIGEESPICSGISTPHSVRPKRSLRA